MQTNEIFEKWIILKEIQLTLYVDMFALIFVVLTKLSSSSNVFRRGAQNFSKTSALASEKFCRLIAKKKNTCVSIKYN